MKILVVDDEEGARELFNTILTDEGYEVTLAVNGEDGLTRFKTAPFDSGGDGHQDAGHGRASAAAGDPQDWFQGRRHHGDRLRRGESYLKAMSLGAAEYINKPIRIKELKRIVHKVLTERKAKPGI